MEKRIHVYTSKGCVSTGLQIHLTVPPFTHFLSVVAHVVAAIFAAAQADAFLEAGRICALVGITDMVLAHQRIYK